MRVATVRVERGKAALVGKRALASEQIGALDLKRRQRLLGVGN